MKSTATQIDMPPTVATGSFNPKPEAMVGAAQKDSIPPPAIASGFGLNDVSRCVILSGEGCNTTSHNARMPSSGRRDGFVLLIVMVVVILISLTGLSFVLTLSTENKAAHLQGDQLRLEQALASGEELVKAVCSQSCESQQELGGVFDNSDLFQGVILDEYEDDINRIRFSVVSPQVEADQITGVRYGLQDESARLNLAVLSKWEQLEEGAAAVALMNLPGMTEAMADAILDWIDPDDAVRPSGAETEFYVARGLPYSPRNGVPMSLEELLLVRDISRLSLFGADANCNYQVDDQETQRASLGTAGRVGGGSAPWASLLTVHSAERNTACNGTPRINLNEKDLQKLHQQLDDAFDPSWARFVVAYRQFGPYGVEPERRGRPTARRTRASRNASRRQSAPQVVRTDTIDDIDLSLPARFEIESVLDLIGAEIFIPGDDEEATEEPEDLIVEGPFADDPNLIREYLPELVDRVSTVSESIIHGRVNVNRAHRAVLFGVPGLERSIVDQIIAARGRGFGDDILIRRHGIWLLTDGIVEVDQMKELMPYITGGGDVFRAQVVACHEASGLSARAEVVVDATVSPPRQIYWKDLSLLGRGFPFEVLGIEGPLQ